MKLTLRWDDERGEGFAKASDVAALMRDPDIATLDFLQDAMAGIAEIYNAALEQMISRQVVCAGVRMPTETAH